MRKKLLFLGAVVVLITGFMIGSCKKSSDYLPTLLTDGQWQLASVQVYYYTGATQDSIVTLDTLCSLTQTLQFSSNNACTYTNFDCISGTTANGHWSFINQNLYLSTDMVVKDTTAVGSSVPFKIAQILNLGQYSLVLQTGDLNTYYPPTQKRVITQWGFVRLKTTQ